MTKEQYSLWLEPEPSSRAEELANAIETLATRLGLPVFRPHVTVVGGFTMSRQEALGVLDLVAVGQSEFVANLVSLRRDDTWNRAAILLAEPGPFAEFYDRANSVMGLEEAHYEPHLSLAYCSDFSLVQGGILDEIEARIVGKMTIDRISLWHTPGVGPETVKDWAPVATTQLEERP